MYRQTKLDPRDLIGAQDDVLRWFHKHPDSDVAAKDIQLFAIPYACNADVVIVLNRLVREGALKRTFHEPTMFTLNVSYSLNQ